MPDLRWSWIFLGFRSMLSISARALYDPSSGWPHRRLAPHSVRSFARSNHRREVSRRLLITGESLRRIRIPRCRLVHVSRQEFGIAPHYRCRCHDIFRRHGRFTDIHSNRFRFHGGTVFRSFPNHIVIGSMRIRPLQDIPTQISFL